MPISRETRVRREGFSNSASSVRFFSAADASTRECVRARIRDRPRRTRGRVRERTREGAKERDREKEAGEGEGEEEGEGDSWGLKARAGGRRQMVWHRRSSQARRVHAHMQREIQ
jgi:hypothetical protein